MPNLGVPAGSKTLDNPKTLDKPKSKMPQDGPSSGRRTLRKRPLTCDPIDLPVPDGMSEMEFALELYLDYNCQASAVIGRFKLKKSTFYKYVRELLGWPTPRCIALPLPYPGFFNFVLIVCNRACVVQQCQQVGRAETSRRWRRAAECCFRFCPGQDES